MKTRGAATSAAAAAATAAATTDSHSDGTRNESLGEVHTFKEVEQASSSLQSPVVILDEMKKADCTQRLDVGIVAPAVVCLHSTRPTSASHNHPNSPIFQL